MKTRNFIFASVASVFVFSAVASAAPVTPATQPAAMTVQPMTPAVMDAPAAVKPDAQPVTPAMTQPVADATAPAMTAATPDSSDTPKYKDPSFWILIGSGILGLVFTILGAFGYTKWAKNERFKMVLKVADNAVTWFRDYAQKSDAKWDDIVAQILAAVTARLGVLTEDEIEVVKKVVSQRKVDLTSGNDTEEPAKSEDVEDKKED